MSAQFRAPFLLSLALAASVACTPASVGLHRATAAPSPSRDIIGEAEIDRMHASTAYDLVQRLRPTFLTWTRSVTPYERRLVFVDGLQMGGLDVLETIPAVSVHEIRLLSGIEAAGHYGTTNSAGAILVTTRLGPRR
jgi:hypothetical protein